MDTRSPLLQFSDFSFKYRAQKQPTLHNINLSIFQGEKILIVGPSGSGKSTLAHCINGLIPFNYPGESSGTLRIRGEETKNCGMFELSKTVGTVLQDPDGQFVGLTAGEDIAFSLENSCIPLNEMKKSVQEAADTVGIRQHLEKSPFNLSGGQKQRVSLAGVIIDHVQMLLFDEPLANLDPATGKQAIELIDTLMNQSNTTVIIIEHRLEDVLHRHVDRIVLMADGHIIADQKPADFLSSDLLTSCGIREPLYLTALKYAGVSISPALHPEGSAELTLTNTEKQLVQKWFNERPNIKPHCKKPELLRVERLSFSYTPDVPVLHEISFHIYEGEMTAIVGTNGAGKSTLAKLICGFEKPSHGQVFFRNKNMESESIAARANKIGYVMQNPNQMISKTMIFDEVAMGLRSRGMAEDIVRTRVEETLIVCGLYSMRSWPISALSFGQKKRVTIASVLVTEPEIIILDEPTAGQDFRHYTDIMEFLLNLNRQGVTVLMITHDMHLMLEYATRALVFSEGKLLADAPSSQVLTSPTITSNASLNETSLFALSKACNIQDGSGFVQRFIDYDREVRVHD